MNSSVTTSASTATDIATPVLRNNRRAAALFVLICLAYLGLRVPVMYRMPGELDEECYAVPGLTILENGIPRLPHVPGRSPRSVFFHADKVLYAEPPLYFYLQAALYSFLPKVYGTARLVSAIAGLGVLGMIWLLTSKAVGGLWGPFWATFLFSLSRWFYFTAAKTRPDLTCTLFGMIAIWCIWNWWEHRQRRWLALGGIAIGLGGLTHFFAIIYAVQLAVWVVLASAGKDRIFNVALLTGVSIGVFLLWTPLILISPELFVTQFKNQLLANNESLFGRAIAPWTSLKFHGIILWLQIRPWQVALASASLIWCTISSLRTKSPALLIVCGLSWSSLYMMSVLVGAHHPTMGYWTYPAALLFLCVGWAMNQLRVLSQRSAVFPSWLGALAVVLIAVGFVPESRARTLLVHLQHWNDPAYNAPRFARQLMADIPPDARCAVDSEYLLDFMAAGRNVIWAQTQNYDFRSDDLPCDVIIVSTLGEISHVADCLCGELERVVGDPTNLYACYARIYRPPMGPCSKGPCPKSTPY